MARIDLKRHRKLAGMTQIGLARRLGVAQSTIAAWESGLSQPVAGYLPDMAEIFECLIEDLYEPEGSGRGSNLIVLEGNREHEYVSGILDIHEKYRGIGATYENPTQEEKEEVIADMNKELRDHYMKYHR